jgi:hypothetical protein
MADALLYGDTAAERADDATVARGRAGDGSIAIRISALLTTLRIDCMCSTVSSVDREFWRNVTEQGGYAKAMLGNRDCRIESTYIIDHPVW